MENSSTVEDCSNYDAGGAAYKRRHYEMAMYDFEQKAVQGDPKAQFCLAFMYKHGKGVRPDIEKAIEWYTKASEQGYGPAQNTLGVMYIRLWEELELHERKFGRTDLETKMFKYLDTAFKWFRKAARQGDPASQFNLGWSGSQYVKYMNLEPEEIIKWWKSTIRAFRDSAAQDYAPAQYELGKIYQFGLLGIDQDSKQALQWYFKAANPNLNAPNFLKMGYAPAQQEVGSKYLVGDGVEKDSKEAFKWFQKAAEQNYPESQFHLGLLYYNGEGIEQDIVEAINWYHKAAANDHPAAQNSLAHLYFEGKGVPQNTEKACRLLFSSAQQADAVAQTNIGIAFENGSDEIPQNYAEAYYWYSLALKVKHGLDQVEAGDIIPEVTQSLERVGNELSQNQKNEIQKQVNNWDPKFRFTAGTGFYIRKNYILTNAHVVDLSDELRIPFHRVELVAADKEIDLALLYDPLGNESNVAFRSSPVDLGEDIFVFGYPLSSMLSYKGNYTSGIVSGLVSNILGSTIGNTQPFDDPQPLNRFQYTAPSQGGNSGGPIVDMGGNVIGVVVGGLNPDRVKNQNVNFAIKFDVIEEFLQKNSIIDYAVTDGSNDPIDLKEIPAKAKEFTVPILNYVNKEIHFPLKEIGIDGLEQE